MEDILGWDVFRIRDLFEKRGFILQEWEKVQTDTLSIVHASEGRNRSLNNAKGIDTPGTKGATANR